MLEKWTIFQSMAMAIKILLSKVYLWKLTPYYSEAYDNQIIC